MPTQLTYPGVYVEEIPSGVRTITGVATSIAAFVGWAPRGPTDRAGLILSWADYERQYGGLDTRSLLSYSVSHFFTNGGTRAYIVRLAGAGNAAAAATIGGNLDVTMNSPGAWGNKYAIVTKRRAAPNDARFQLRVIYFTSDADKKGVAVESFENLSMDTSDARFVTNVLNSESRLIVAKPKDGGPAGAPTDTVIPANGEIPDDAKLKNGADGTVLAPDQPAFENAALPISGTGGVFTLDRIDLFNLLCVPGETNADFLGKLQAFCRARRAFLIADSKSTDSLDTLKDGPNGSMTGDDSINAAFYFPWIRAADPLQENRPSDYPPCGYLAGLYARTDANRGVWKAPAGTEASLVGVLGVKTPLTNDENGVLNPKAVNCIRVLPIYGTVSWGARTMQGNDERGSEWKYIPVRRTALFLEESLYRALTWVVFEPNDEPLWAQIRLNVGAFLQDLFRQGAFQGKTPQEAYFVKCDKDTTTQSDINRGVVNIVVGFAPLKPAEFVVIKIQQIAGQIQV